MLRRLTSLLFAAALIFNLVGAYLVFESTRVAVRKEIKKRIKAGVPEKDLHVLRFRLDDVESGSAGIQWKHKGEFSYRGKMYDIVRKTADQEFITYYCINDTEEEQLFARLDELVNDYASGDKNTRDKTRNKLRLLVQELVKPAMLTLSVFPGNLRVISGFTFAFTEYCPEIPSPPPRPTAWA